ncbi:MAG TPA: response regulator [Candidatus Limnocylindrales bacterium]|nr:response regulator [Candidatus Limnocylindrales bacterium]
MPNESILVVDDAPVNLKLADLVLRKEGFQVFAVPDAEEALRVLRTVHPKLMLVDIQLPGMDGLELTRRVKQEAHTSDVIVIALTACAMKGDEERAMQAGCDGYITKPINTQTFGRRIREYLTNTQPKASTANGHAIVEPVKQTTAELHPPTVAPAKPGLPSGLELSALELESLRRRFLEEGILQSRQILMDLGAKFDIQKAKSLVHRWVGAAGALGYGQIAVLARDTKDLLDGERIDAKVLREKLSELALAFTDPREAVMDTLPPAMIQEIAGKRIAMVCFAAEEAERLCSTLETLGARPRLFDSSESPDSEGIRNCQAIMLHVREEAMTGPWLDPRCVFPPGRAMVLVGNRDRIMALDHAVQTRAQEFLIDGWQPEEAMMRLVFALSRVSAQRPSPWSHTTASPAGAPVSMQDANVLIADDDPAVRAVLQAAFREHRVTCRLATSGEDALKAIRESPPDVAVLDVNMPGLDGFEVLSAIRAARLNVRVIMLTARSKESDVVQGFNLGADDYVVKPFNPMEVVVRLKRLAGRP